MFRSYALECKTAFIAEERSKVYKEYSARLPQKKMSFFYAKNDLQGRTLFGLGRRGA